tara:strand:- start:329 stop:1030 length:702 start_codon:yes stop_codon:yes gene_type:complete
MAHSKSEIKKAKNLLNKYAPKGEQLAYINSKEAKLLKSKGGAGKMTKAGIRSYAYSDSRDDPGGDNQTGNSSNNSDNGGGNDQPVSARSMMQNVAAVKPQSMLSRIGNFIKGGGVTGMLLRGAKNQLQYLNAKDKTKREANVELGLGGQDTIASLTGGNNGGEGNTPAMNIGGRIIKLSPTTAEISQSGATDASPYDNRKTKARGRSMTIMTSSRGINRNNTLTLGKPSLLGA